jgi:hypothetical protein
MGNHYPSLLCSSVATGIADISFRLSLLISWVIDVNAARRYYAAWSL